MIRFLKPVAHAAVYRLAKSGVHVARSEPRAKAVGIMISDEEMDRFAADVDAVYATGASFGVWSEPNAVKSYVDKARVKSYHEVLAAAEAAGVKFDGKRVIDVGSCSGYLLRLIGERYPSATLAGTDYYEDFVSLSTALVPSARVVKASIDDLTSADETYDVVFCTEVLEHIVDTESQIPKLMRLVAPGGALVITVPNGRHDTTPGLTSDDGTSYVGHVNFWSPESWKFYIERIAGDHRHVLGSLGVHFVGDALSAVIFQN